MTTMDSDSESQDSDEGRRFRFEATRKDPITALQSRRKDISPYSNSLRRRARSREHARYTRREDKKTSDSTKERTNDRNNHEERRSSKDQKSGSSDSKRNKGVRNKNRESEKTYEVSRDVQKRDSSCRDARILKNRDEKRKRSHDRSWENKSRDKYRKYPREKERLNQRHKSSQRQNPCEEEIGNHNKAKRPELLKKDIQEMHDPQDCKDLNLSDFDIVSDTEENSDNIDEAIESTNDEIEGRDRNSKENDKVTFRNDDKSPGSYFSNPDDVSDFLLASTSAKSISTNNSNTPLCKHDKAGLKKLDLERESEKAVDKYDEIDEKNYGPALPPSVKTKSCDSLKIIGPCLPEYLKKFGDTNDEEDNQFGPALPPHLQKKEDATTGSAFLDATETATVVDEDEEGVVGPLPADHPALKDDLVQQQLEYRAQLIKRELAEIVSTKTPVVLIILGI